MQIALGILEERADAKQKTSVADVREDVQQMSGLVHELLSFSKASLEPAAIKLEPVNLRNVADQAVRREAGEGGQIQVEIASDLDVLANADLLLRRWRTWSTTRRATQGMPGRSRFPPAAKAGGSCFR